MSTMNKPEHHNLMVDGRAFLSPADGKKIKQNLALMDRAVKESKNELQKVRDVAAELEQGTHVMLSKQGLAKIHMDGILKSGHSYEWVLDNNYHTIDRVDTIDGINFYALTGFAKYYYFTIDDLIQIPAGYDIGDMVQFTRESLVRLGAVLSEYYQQDDTININKLLQDITGPHRVIYIQRLDGELVYRLSGECFGKHFYEHEIEPVNK